MGYGSQLLSLSESARNRGQQGLESGLARLAQSAAQASDQAFQAREARKQREFQEEQQKKQEKAQKKAMWTSLGINAGTGAVGGAVTGGLAASMPAVGGGVAAGGYGIPEAAYGAAQGAAAPAFTPFAGGSVGGGALAGGALGALGGLSGQNYLAPALAMPAQNYALASNAFNTANNQALQWAEYNQRGKMNEANNQARIEAAKMANDARMYGADNSLLGRMYGADTSAYNTGRRIQEQGRQFDARLPIFQQNADAATSRAETGRGMMDLRGRQIDETGRHNQTTESIQQQRANDYGKYVGQSGSGFAPTVTMTPGESGPKVSVSGKNMDRVRETYNSVTGTIPDNFEGAKQRIANTLNEGGDPEPIIDYMLKQGSITQQQADEIRRRLPRR